MMEQTFIYSAIPYQDFRIFYPIFCYIFILFLIFISHFFGVPWDPTPAMPIRDVRGKRFLTLRITLHPTLLCKGVGKDEDRG